MRDQVLHIQNYIFRSEMIKLNTDVATTDGRKWSASHFGRFTPDGLKFCG